MLDFPELLTPKNKVMGAKAMDLVSPQTLKFCICNRLSKLFLPYLQMHVITPRIQIIVVPKPTQGEPFGYHTFDDINVTDSLYGRKSQGHLSKAQ